MSKIAGFTLIEVLVSMIILAVGLLGLANLQVFGLKNSQSSFNRSQASLLAYDIADRMRANITEARKFSTSAYITTTTPSVQTACNEVSTSCTTGKMAQNDLYQWKETLSTTLPSGTGSIAYTNSIYTITVSWVEKRPQNESDDDGESSDTSNFLLRFQL